MLTFLVDVLSVIVCVTIFGTGVFMFLTLLKRF